jgi:hypothetical protein
VTPVAAEAQAGKVYRIGVPIDVAPREFFSSASSSGLAELGYIVGKNLVIEFRTPLGQQRSACREPSMGSGCGRPSGRQVCANQN